MIEFTFTLKTTNSTQLRVTAAKPGTVNFELDIKQEHTVRLRSRMHFTSSYEDY